MKNNNVNGVRKHILVKRMYFSPRISLNDIVSNATTRIELTINKKMNDTNIKHITNPTWQ